MQTPVMAMVAGLALIRHQGPVEGSSPIKCASPGRRNRVRLDWYPVMAPDRASVIALQPLDDQRHFIASNADSLAEADGNPDCVPLMLRLDGVPIGFALYALDGDDGNYWIYRFMIDHRHQSRGYGRLGLASLIEHITATTGCPRIMLGVRPDNVIARRLYDGAGFRPAGFEHDGEVILTLETARP